MSLIIDALKRAQQLRINESKGPSMLRYPHPDKNRRRGFLKRGMVIVLGLSCFSILLFVLLKPVSPPFAIPTPQANIVLEKKPSALAAKKMSQEPPKEGLSLTENKEPLTTGQAPNRAGSGQVGAEGLPYIGAAFSGRPPQSQGEKASPDTKPSPIEKRGESLTNQLPEEEELNPPEKRLAKKELPPLPPVAQREETPPPLFGVGQEEKKKKPPALEYLTYFNLGIQFYHQKEFSKAIQAYQKVIELDPTYVEAYNNLGIIYQMVGDMDRAFDAYQKSTEINPRYEKGYNNLGTLLLLRGRYEEALEAFQKALSTNSNNIESHINLGILFKKTAQWGEAVKSYQRALAIDPLHREAHYNMALLYERLENLDLAIHHYQQFIQLSQKSHPELVSKVQRHLNTLVEAKK